MGDHISEVSKMVERLNAVWRDGDHERLCQGREYSCTCGFDERTEATTREAASLLQQQEAEIARLREDRDGALRANEALNSVIDRCRMDASAAEARVKVLESALKAAMTWHEEQDKSLSKQPPSSGPNGNQWARLQHREQLDQITEALQDEVKE